MQRESSDARGHQLHASPASTRAPTPRLRFIFLALVALSVVGVLAVSSRMGVSLSPSARLKALQTSHQQLVETLRQGTGADHYGAHEDGSGRTADKSTEALHVLKDPATDGIPASSTSPGKASTESHAVPPVDEELERLPPDVGLRLLDGRGQPPAVPAALSTVPSRRQAVKKVSLADMARYALLHQVGGLYVDADFECLQPFDELHRGRNLFLSSEPLVHAVLLEKSRSAALCNALMASAPGHPFWLQVLDNIKESSTASALEATRWSSRALGW